MSRLESAQGGVKEHTFHPFSEPDEAGTAPRFLEGVEPVPALPPVRDWSEPSFIEALHAVPELACSLRGFYHSSALIVLDPEHPRFPRLLGGPALQLRHLRRVCRVLEPCVGAVRRRP